jgi:protein associated with RNAse G/E
MTSRISVRSLRYDGSLRDQFDADLLDAHDGVYRVRVHRGDPVQTPGGTIAEVATATQLLFTGRWYNVNHIHEIVAPYRNYWYTNLAMPVRFDGGELLWVDLDLDVMHDIDRGVMLKDVELFEQRAASGYYPTDIVDRVYAARDEILALAADGAFPFDRERHIATPPSPLPASTTPPDPAGSGARR